MHKALLPLLLVTIPVLAQPVYSYKDSSGHIVYTNQQPPANTNNVEKVKLPKIQTMSDGQLKSQLNKKNSVTRDNQQSAVISEVFIKGIPTEEALRANDGTFTVTVVLNTANKALPSSYQYLLLLDGQRYGAGPQAGPNFTLTNLDRGSHTIQAQILNHGQVVAASNTQSFTLQRVANPARKVTPQPRSRK